MARAPDTEEHLLAAPRGAQADPDDGTEPRVLGDVADVLPSGHLRNPVSGLEFEVQGAAVLLRLRSLTGNPLPHHLRLSGVVVLDPETRYVLRGARVALFALQSPNAAAAHARPDSAHVDQVRRRECEAPRVR